MKEYLHIFIKRFYLLMALFIFIFCINLAIGQECYQETANASNINDGTCNLNYSGSYNHNPVTLNINYIKPIGSDGAVWITRIGNGSYYNFTIPSDCWNLDNTTLNLSIFTNHFYSGALSPSSSRQILSCYNSSGSNQLYNVQHTLANGGDTGNLGGWTGVMIDGDWTTQQMGLIATPSQYFWSYGTIIDGCSEFARVYEEGIMWNIPCIPNWIETDTTCNGYNYTIEYTDDNMCNNSINLPIDNGTIIDCCDSNWTLTVQPCVNSAQLQVYQKTFDCTNETVPSQNGTYVACNNVVYNTQVYPDYFFPFIILFVALILSTVLGFWKPIAFYLGALILGLMLSLVIYYDLDKIAILVFLIMIIMYVGLAFGMKKIKE